MTDKAGRHLTFSEVQIVLRRAAERADHRKKPGTSERASVSPELLIEVASAMGISEPDVRLALSDLTSAKAFEPESIPKRLYGTARTRSVREIEQPIEIAWQHLEILLRRDQGLKLRSKTEASSLWNSSGDMLGMVRRTLDPSDPRVLLKTQSVELRVKEVSKTRSHAYLTADLSNQRSEYLFLGGILGATLALALAIAGVYEPLYFLLVLPALAAPSLWLKRTYKKSCADTRRVLDAILTTAEHPSGTLDEIRNLRVIPDSQRRPRREL